jgi:Meiotically up-regulated gene 113
MANRTSPQQNGAGFIYILRPRVLVDDQEVIKIGITTRTVAQRVRELTTGSMVPFEVVYSLYVENARSLEKQLHFRYRSRRLIGGGQEFFRVPSEEVIGEIKKIETEISKERARGVRNAEMAVFQMQIGATRIENLISFPMMILFIPCWFGGVWMIREEAHQFMGYS